MENDNEWKNIFGGPVAYNHHHHNVSHIIGQPYWTNFAVEIDAL